MKNNKKNIFDKMSDSYDNFHLKDTEKMMGNETFYFSPKMKLIFAWCIFLILCVVLYFVVGLPTSDRKKDKAVSTESVEKDKQQEVTQEQVSKEASEETAKTDDGEETDVSYEKNTDEDLNAFIKLYFSAMADCDNNVLQDMVIDASQFKNADSLKKKAQYIKGYDNITVYTKEGPEEGNYVVFVLMNLTIAGVNSSPYDIMTLFVVDGSHGFLIDNSNLVDERKSYIEQVKGDSDIQEIYRFVESKNEELRKEDPTLQAFYDTINGQAPNTEKEQEEQDRQEEQEDQEEQDRQEEQENQEEEQEEQ